MGSAALNIPKSKHSIVGRTPVGIFGILDSQTGQQVFDYDTFVSAKLDAKTRVSTFPVESGAFVTYNKAAAPYTARVEIAVSDLADRRHALIVALDNEKNGTRLFNITTQDATFLNYTLENFSVSFTRQIGWGIVIALLDFVEVREVTPSYGNARAGAGGTKSGGVGATPIAISQWSSVQPTDFKKQGLTTSNGPFTPPPKTGSAYVDRVAKSPKASPATLTVASGPSSTQTSTTPSVK